MSVEEQVRKIISDTADGLDGAAIPATARLIETGLDSLDIATVLLEVQESFGVTIPDGKENDLDTIARIVAFVESGRS